MPAPNQIASKKREDVSVTAADLLKFEPEAPITEKGLRLNINVAIQYVGAWLAGQGAVPIFNLMEDAATAEISRTQVWQWLRHGAKLRDGRAVTPDLIRETIATQLGHIRSSVGGRRYDAGQFPLAAKLFEEMMLSGRCADFLTLAAYEHI
jgi:malate synthase